MSNSIAQRTASGAAAGFIATGPMSMVMVGLHWFLPWWKRTTLEPRLVTSDMLRRLGLEDDLSETLEKQVTVAAHFGYGAACGAAYGLAEPLIPAPRGARGPLFGVLVWAASYAGWLPAVGTLPPPNRYPWAREALLIASHIVWGAASEATYDKLANSNGAQHGSV